MNCGRCHRCLEGAYVNNTLTDPPGSMRLPVTATMMILCPICGNKRCPKATDHELSCTGSNDPDQAGSVYSNLNFRTLDE